MDKKNKNEAQSPIHYFLMTIFLCVIVFPGCSPREKSADPQSQLAYLQIEIKESLEGEEYARAAALGEKALPLAEETYGPNAIEILMFRFHLVTAYTGLYQLNKAQDEAEKIVSISRSSFGPEHVFTGLGQTILGVIYREKGQQAKGDALVDTGAPIVQMWLLNTSPQVFGLNSPMRLELLTGAAETLCTLEFYAEAEPLWVEALRISEEIHGPGARETVEISNHLATAYRAQGKYAEAAGLSN